MRRLIVMAPLVIALAACSDGKAPAAQGVPGKPVFASGTSAATTAATAGASAASSASAAAAGGQAFSIKEENDLYDFAYSYPAAAGAIPGLRAWLDADRAARHQQLVADASDGKAAAHDGGGDYHALAEWTAWSVVTQTADWLSLSAGKWSYGGGAHGNSWHGSLIWDKRAARALDPVDLFVSRAALAAAIRAPFCAELDRQRAEKRGGAVAADPADPFGSCIDPAQSTVILGSADHRKIGRIGILVAPYEAGPYVEGEYEITLPVTQTVLAAVKPQYRDSFAAP